MMIIQFLYFLQVKQIFNKDNIDDIEKLNIQKQTNTPYFITLQ